MCTHGRRVWNDGQRRLAGVEGWRGRGVDDRRQSGGYHVHCFSDGCSGGPDFTTMQFINVAKLDLYPMIIYK